MRSRKQKSPPVEPQADRSDPSRLNSSAPRTAQAPSSEIAGFRVGRSLGSDADADLYLGHSAHRGSEPDRQQNVTLKLFRTDAASTQIERELAARSQLPPGLLGALLDVSTLADGRVAVVLEHLAGGSLVRYLRDYAPVPPGEAVTILAPIVHSVAALHSAGFALPDLSVASIELSAEGRPMIDRLGALESVPPPAVDVRTRRELHRSDYDRAIRVMREVFAALDPTDPAARHAEGIAGWGEEAAEQLTIAECLEGLEHALFGWAAAEPLRMRHQLVAREGREGNLHDLPLRRVDLAPVPSAKPLTLPPAAAAEAEPHVPRDGRGRAARAMRAVRDLLVRLRMLRSSRPALVAIVLVVGLTVLSLAALSTDDGADDAASGSTRASTSEPMTAPDDLGTAAEREVIVADDPVAAAVALLALRSKCLAGLSLLCLDSVDQSGSAAMDADRYAVRMAQQTGSSVTVQAFGADATLVERNGDSALVEIMAAPGERNDANATDEKNAEGYSKPASLLMIRGEAGWRVREIFDY